MAARETLDFRNRPITEQHARERTAMSGVHSRNILKRMPNMNTIPKAIAAALALAASIPVGNCFGQSLVLLCYK